MIVYSVTCIFLLTKDHQQKLNSRYFSQLNTISSTFKPASLAFKEFNLLIFALKNCTRRTRRISEYFDTISCNGSPISSEIGNSRSTMLPNTPPLSLSLSLHVLQKNKHILRIIILFWSLPE